MKHNYLIKTLLVFCLAITCGFNSSSASEPELVMTPGMTIEANTPAGKITIDAIDDLTRRYSWNSYKRTFRHNIRNRRWYGSMGMHGPDSESEIHVALNEGQQHFYSTEEALFWLIWENKRMQYVYTSDGLVIGWKDIKNKEDGSLYALVVNVWQIYIQGKKPTELYGANNDKIHISFSNAPSYPHVGKFTPSSPENINNRMYSGKAIDFMKEFNVPTSKAEELIRKGKQYKESNYIWYSGSWLIPSIDILVVTDLDGRVLLVEP